MYIGKARKPRKKVFANFRVRVSEWTTHGGPWVELLYPRVFWECFFSHGEERKATFPPGRYRQLQRQVLPWNLPRRKINDRLLLYREGKKRKKETFISRMKERRRGTRKKEKLRVPRVSWSLEDLFQLRKDSYDGEGDAPPPSRKFLTPARKFPLKGIRGPRFSIVARRFTFHNSNNPSTRQRCF